MRVSALVDLGGEASVVEAALKRRSPRGAAKFWTAWRDLRGFMTNEGWSVVLGTAAGFCTTVSFVPQVIKIYRQGGRDLSYGMLSLYLVGVLLWFGYGVVVRARAVVITNLATAVLIAIATGMKAYTAKRDFGKAVMGDVGVGD